MTISSAIKRLQFLEDNYGGHIEVSVVDDTGAHVTSEEIIMDVRDPGTGKVCAIMPLSYWESIAPRGVNLKND